MNERQKIFVSRLSIWVVVASAVSLAQGLSAIQTVWVITVVVLAGFAFRNFDLFDKD